MTFAMFLLNAYEASRTAARNKLVPQYLFIWLALRSTSEIILWEQHNYGGFDEQTLCL